MPFHPDYHDSIEEYLEMEEETKQEKVETLFRNCGTDVTKFTAALKKAIAFLDYEPERFEISYEFVQFQGMDSLLALILQKANTFVTAMTPPAPAPVVAPVDGAEPLQQQQNQNVDTTDSSNNNKLSKANENAISSLLFFLFKYVLIVEEHGLEFYKGEERHKQIVDLCLNKLLAIPFVQKTKHFTVVAIISTLVDCASIDPSSMFAMTNVPMSIFVHQGSVISSLLRLLSSLNEYPKFDARLTLEEMRTSVSILQVLNKIFASPEFYARSKESTGPNEIIQNDLFFSSSPSTTFYHVILQIIWWTGFLEAKITKLESNKQKKQQQNQTDNNEQQQQSAPPLTKAEEKLYETEKEIFSMCKSTVTVFTQLTTMNTSLPSSPYSSTFESHSLLCFIFSNIIPQLLRLATKKTFNKNGDESLQVCETVCKLATSLLYPSNGGLKTFINIPERSVSTLALIIKYDQTFGESQAALQNGGIYFLHLAACNVIDVIENPEKKEETLRMLMENSNNSVFYNKNFKRSNNGEDENNNNNHRAILSSLANWLRSIVTVDDHGSTNRNRNTMNNTKVSHPPSYRLRFSQTAINQIEMAWMSRVGEDDDEMKNAFNRLKNEVLLPNLGVVQQRTATPSENESAAAAAGDRRQRE